MSAPTRATIGRRSFDLAAFERHTERLPGLDGLTVVRDAAETWRRKAA